jgi:hypothetical protein
MVHRIRAPGASSRATQPQNGGNHNPGSEEAPLALREKFPHLEVLEGPQKKGGYTTNLTGLVGQSGNAQRRRPPAGPGTSMNWTVI